MAGQRMTETQATDAPTHSPESLARLARLRCRIARHLDAIGGLFAADVKLTLVVRMPGAPDFKKDLVMSEDDLLGAIETLRWAHDRPVAILADDEAAK
jgi:hypothetical protein